MVVVTGATGHLGNVLVRELLARDVPVRAVIPRGEDTSSLDGLKVEKVEGNVLDPDSLVRAFQGAEVVYHLAGVLFTSPRRTRLFYQINVDGTRNVIDACLKCGVKKMVHTSTIGALVEPPKGTVYDEKSHFDPDKVVGHYNKSKAQASLDVLGRGEEGAGRRDPLSHRRHRPL